MVKVGVEPFQSWIWVDGAYKSGFLSLRRRGEAVGLLPRVYWYFKVKPQRGKQWLWLQVWVMIILWLLQFHKTSYTLTTSTRTYKKKKAPRSTAKKQQSSYKKGVCVCVLTRGALMWRQVLQRRHRDNDAKRLFCSSNICNLLTVCPHQQGWMYGRGSDLCSHGRINHANPLRCVPQKWDAPAVCVGALPPSSVPWSAPR